MEKDTPILLFTLSGERFGIDATTVKEIVWLPELTPVEEASPFIAGVVNLRGNIVPVIDMATLFGHPQERYSLSDCVVILEAEGFVKGIIVNEVNDVQTISPGDIEPALDDGRKKAHFVAGEGKMGEEVVMLLDHVKLIRYSTKRKGKTAPPAFCPEATGEERESFHRRAHQLMQPAERLVLKGFVPLAVFSLGNEYFGVRLDVVREFANIRGVAPVPCTPQHIAGNMNLRGEVLTLVNIHGIMKMPLTAPVKEAKAVVVRSDEILAGVPVDELLEVIYLLEEEIKPAPASVEAISDEYILGTFPYGGKMLSILDLRKILTNEELVVNEEV
ncbi:MAG: chemotaxis protein CheW [Nitrospirales bacterium]|nr:chemotaxis protein CheW [Nitrospirales bacterium]